MNQLRSNEPLVQASQHEANSRYLILIVEDDTEIRELNEEWLTGEGYRVKAVANGEEGWEALQLHNYHLLITDNTMPKMTGLELIMKVRSARLTIPVILASGGLPNKEPNWNRDLQVNATVAKPYTKNLLLDAVHKVLGPS